jgi:hypothetical protein
MPRSSSTTRTGAGPAGGAMDDKVDQSIEAGISTPRSS